MGPRRLAIGPCYSFSSSSRPKLERRKGNEAGYLHDAREELVKYYLYDIKVLITLLYLIPLVLFVKLLYWPDPTNIGGVLAKNNNIGSKATKSSDDDKYDKANIGENGNA
ncbi:hypothetical protein BT67DRAFT_436910 [Trichocladium antarcticum]|uniref:Uncharacterized protein n=1 Tax=Trichocladium antarcticum TaxID=1450529 RepID=A0AAN6UCP4_9PEZI|nr:hypothetical protein BT67DRAFT_436910 [Trichocladium antarcticum]